MSRSRRINLGSRSLRVSTVEVPTHAPAISSIARPDPPRLIAFWEAVWLIEPAMMVARALA
jgi:hypothetical protein